jgi:hypothetical protein
MVPCGRRGRNFVFMNEKVRETFVLGEIMESSKSKENHLWHSNVVWDTSNLSFILIDSHNNNFG